MIAPKVTLEIDVVPFGLRGELLVIRISRLLLVVRQSHKLHVDALLNVFFLRIGEKQRVGYCIHRAAEDHASKRVTQARSSRRVHGSTSHFTRRT